MTEEVTEPTEDQQVETGQTEDQQTEPGDNISRLEPENDETEETEPAEPEPETFPAEYVRQLRDENKTKRLEAKEATDRAEALAQRLHTALVTATGRLADPTDLPYDAEHLDDPGALTAAIDGLLARKPHLASRKPVGNVGQGETGGGSGGVDLAALLRARA